MDAIGALAFLTGGFSENGIGIKDAEFQKGNVSGVNGGRLTFSEYKHMALLEICSYFAVSNTGFIQAQNLLIPRNGQHVICVGEFGRNNYARFQLNKSFDLEISQNINAYYEIWAIAFNVENVTGL